MTMKLFVISTLFSAAAAGGRRRKPGATGCDNNIPDGTKNNVASFWNTTSTEGEHVGDFTDCENEDVKNFIRNNSNTVCTNGPKWITKEWCEQTCYEMVGYDGAHMGLGYSDCSATPSSIEAIEQLAATGGLTGNLNAIISNVNSDESTIMNGLTLLSDAAGACTGGEVYKRMFPNTNDTTLAQHYTMACVAPSSMSNADLSVKMQSAFLDTINDRSFDSETTRLEVDLATTQGEPIPASLIDAAVARRLRRRLAVDDPNWRFRNKPDRGCDWVLKNLFRRCEKQGAEEACAATCATDGQGVRSTVSDKYYAQGKQTNLPNGRIDEAWETTTGAAHVVVNVVDSGLDLDHVEHQGNIWVNEGEICDNGIDDDGNGFVDDCNGYNHADGTGIDLLGSSTHGTFCSGIIAAARNNNEGMSGIAGGNYGEGVPENAQSGVKIMTSVIFGDTGARNQPQAIVYGVDNGAQISSNSWGYSSPGYIGTAVKDAIDYAVSKGVVVVFASGNNGENADYYPGRYNGPNDDPDYGVLAVGSIDVDDGVSSFSNYGEWVDIYAVGQSVIGTKIGQSYGISSGTSYACPTVSAIIGLGLSKYPAATNLDLVGCLKISEGGSRSIDDVPANAAYYAGGERPVREGYGAIDAMGFLECVGRTQAGGDPSPAPTLRPTPQPSKRPTPRPTPQPVATNECDDDENWRGARRGVPVATKTCANIARKGADADRCAKEDVDGVAATAACGCTCSAFR